MIRRAPLLAAFLLAPLSSTARSQAQGVESEPLSGPYDIRCSLYFGNDERTRGVFGLRWDQGTITLYLVSAYRQSWFPSLLLPSSAGQARVSMPAASCESKRDGASWSIACRSGAGTTLEYVDFVGGPVKSQALEDFSLALSGSEPPTKERFKSVVLRASLAARRSTDGAFVRDFTQEVPHLPRLCVASFAPELRELPPFFAEP